MSEIALQEPLFSSQHSSMFDDALLRSVRLAVESSLPFRAAIKRVFTDWETKGRAVLTAADARLRFSDGRECTGYLVHVDSPTHSVQNLRDIRRACAKLMRRKLDGVQVIHESPHAFALFAECADVRTLDACGFVYMPGENQPVVLDIRNPRLRNVEIVWGYPG